MKTTKTLVFAVTALILSCIAVFSQSKSVPEDLKIKLFNAKNSGNVELANQINKEIETYLDKTTPVNTVPSGFVEIKPGSQPQTDWYYNEVLVASEYLGDLSHKQLDIKQGPDGNLYSAAVVKSNALYGVECYRSTNGGANWDVVGGFLTNDKIFSLSMLVESRKNSNPDSTRYWLFYTASPHSNGDDAALRVYSGRVNGTGNFTLIIGAPAPGSKYEFASACSDGQLWEEQTYMHIIVTQLTNADGYLGLRHFRTTNWGASFTNAQINTGFDDDYPSAAFLRGGSDSVFIAVERKINSLTSQVKVLSTHNIPTGNYVTRSLGTNAINIKYQKPVITCTQRNAVNSFMVTCEKEGIPLWFHSTNGGASWSSEQVISAGRQIKYVHCASDSMAAGDNNFVVTCVSPSSDSLLVYQGKPGAMNLLSVKINSQYTANYVYPACVVYRDGNNKSAGVLYAGLSETNLYFNGSHLITGIQNINSNIPSGFNLSQNYPNPFNPVTNIEFSVPKSGNVKLTVFDITGKQIEQLVNSQMNAGTYKVDFNAGSLSSGIYFYTLEADGFKQTKKMMLVK